MITIIRFDSLSVKILRIIFFVFYCFSNILHALTFQFIEMNFTRFNLSSESSSETGSLSCLSADSKLTLRDGASSNSPLIGIYCGQDGSNKVWNS